MTKEVFNKTEKLYHYTSFDCGIKILNTKELFFAELKNLNDINESYRNIYYGDTISEDEIKTELSKYKQCSLTKDSQNKGFNIPAMWGHYAVKGTGMCIVFNKEKILPTQNNIFYHDIKYDASYDSSIIIDRNIKQFFKDHRNSLFFTKTNDWSYEQEYRILKYDEHNDRKNLALNDSIIAIILYSAEDLDWGDSVFKSKNYETLSNIVPSIPILEVGSFFGETTLKDSKGNNWIETTALQI